MTTDRTPAHLLDMVQFADELLSLTRNLDVEAFRKNRVLCLAVEKLFINLGEAASRVAAERAQSMTDIPWRRIIGLRNILAHGYEQVAHEILFKTIQEELPTLALMLGKALIDLEDRA
jgi:uncharacterized protein with HEPN domain